MRKLFGVFLLFVLTIAFLPASGAAEDIKIGYINMQRALENSAAGQQATKNLSGMWESYKTQIQSEQNKLEELKAEIDKQSLLWNETTRRDKEAELRRNERDYNRLLKDVQDEIKSKEAELSANIGKEILNVIAEIGKSDGYTIILEKKSSAVLYAPESIDLTDRVIKAYDSRKQ